MILAKKPKQTTKICSLADEIKHNLPVSVVCVDYPVNNSGGLVVGDNYTATNIQEYCGNKYLAVLTPKGEFWYHESRFELTKENK